MVIRFLQASAAIVLSLPALATTARGAVFDDDDRIVASTEINSPYAPIGVASPLSGTGSWLLPRYATGFLIGKCHALTVQHLLGSSQSPIGKRVRFSAGFTSQRQSSHGTVVLAGGLESIEGKASYEGARARDWMVIKLDNCIGRLLGHVVLQPSLPGSRLKSAGFPSGLVRAPLKIDPNCRFRFRTKYLALNDCASLSGNSGSPIFEELTIGDRTTLVVYAMQTAGWNLRGKPQPFEWRYANVAIPVSNIWRKIERADSENSQLQIAER